MIAQAKDEVTPTELRNVRRVSFYRQVIPTGLEEDALVPRDWKKTRSSEIYQASVTES